MAEDVTPSEELTRRKQGLIQDAYNTCYRYIDEYKSGNIVCQPGQNAEETLESKVRKDLNEVTLAFSSRPSPSRPLSQQVWSPRRLPLCGGGTCRCGSWQAASAKRRCPLTTPRRSWPGVAPRAQPSTWPRWAPVAGWRSFKREWGENGAGERGGVSAGSLTGKGLWPPTDDRLGRPTDHQWRPCAQWV